MKCCRTIRVLHDAPLDGPANMARDEALMVRVGSSDSPPTLRFYQWNPPTISLGYFQRYADYEALDRPQDRLPVVRRLTGGGAILHDLELTYSLSLPIDHPLVVAGPNQLYEIMHDAIIGCARELGISPFRDHPTDRASQKGGRLLVARQGQAQLGRGNPRAQPDRLERVTQDQMQAPTDGSSRPFAQHRMHAATDESSSSSGARGRRAEPFFCFTRRHRYDVLVDQDKLAGSAQRRTQHALLQHGSIMLGNRYAVQPTAVVSLPFDKSIDLLRSALPQQFAQMTGQSLVEGEWSSAELTAADGLTAKYAGDPWTRRT